MQTIDEKQIGQISGGDLGMPPANPMCAQSLNDLMNSINANDPMMFNQAVGTLAMNCQGASITAVELKISV